MLQTEINKKKSRLSGWLKEINGETRKEKIFIGLDNESCLHSEKKITELFSENEYNVGKLYELYSKKFSHNEKFWRKLSEEEFGHADDIKNYGKTEVEFVENNFTRDVICYVMSFVTEEIENARYREMTHLEAVNIALRIEQSILEKKCFDFFPIKNQFLKKLIIKLNNDTERHVRMLKKELKFRLKNKNN